MIFVSGIHGVGKTYFCNMMREQLGIRAYSASKLITEQSKQAMASDKHVTDVDKNQMFLRKAINELRMKQEEFILDGHFCLLNKDGGISRISLDIFTFLNPDVIVLLMEKPSIISERRFQRDGISINENSLYTFQEEEKKYAEEIATTLNIQLIVSAGSDDLMNIIGKIGEEKR